MFTHKSRWLASVVWLLVFCWLPLSGGCRKSQEPAGKSKVAPPAAKTEPSAASRPAEQARTGWIELFNGKDLKGWRTYEPGDNLWQTAAKLELDPAADHKKFIITPGEGILVNGPKDRTINLCTEADYGDCEVHVEFLVAKASNSGVYFQGKYEIQILDSYGNGKQKPEYSDCGAIYPRWIDGKNADGTAPRVNASKPPGEWQTYDVIFHAPRFDQAGKKIANARFVKVVHNGVVIHENVELKGPTRSHMEGPEVPRGPLMLQGDHAPIAYRNLRIRPLN